MLTTAAAAQRQFKAARGQLLHSALEQLWGVLGDRDGLRRQREQHSLEALIERSVAVVVAAVQSEQRRLGAPERERFWQLEAIRNSGLLARWLSEIELARHENFQVTLREARRELQLSGVPFKLRVDRVDTLIENDSKQLIVIDYKSGKIAGSLAKRWCDDRPTDLQLPLYALAMEPAEIPVRGLAYAQLRTEELRWRSWVQWWGDPPPQRATATAEPSRTTWPQQLQLWRDRLTDLAAEFALGEAAVDPRDQNSCRYCACATLCRIAEQRR